MNRKLLLNGVVSSFILWGLLAVVSPPTVLSDTTPVISFISSFLPARLGTVKQFYSPSGADMGYIRPDFIVIENVHYNRSVQRHISGILNCLKERKLLPRRIAIEGAIGPVNLKDVSMYSDAESRRMNAERLLSTGEMPGVVHFVVAGGQGTLYGVEDERLYQASLDMFRRSYEARMRLIRELNKLQAGLVRLQHSPELSVRVSILMQDIEVLRRLLAQRLEPLGIHRSIHQAVFAIDHLKTILAKEVSQNLLEPVSAAIDLYALTRLRDEAMYQGCLKLRKQDHQTTTVLVVGGFHAKGLTTRFRERGYSYAVITPVVNLHNQVDERLYLERILGQRLSTESTPPSTDVVVFQETDASNDIALTGVLEAPYGALQLYQTQEVQRSDIARTTARSTIQDEQELDRLARRLHATLFRTQLSNHLAKNLFSAMDNSWLDPAIRRAVVQQRAEML